MHPSEADRLALVLTERGVTMCCAESCTGGMIGATMTEAPGSSAYVLGSAVTYSNEAKMRILGVSEGTLVAHGAVSDETAREMAIGAVRAFGAELVLTDAKKGMAGAVEEAGRVKKAIGDVFIPDQFGNPDNPMAHYLSTGPEIYADLPEIDVLVCAFGTGGTISGCARYLKEKKDVRVVAVEPAESPLVSEGRSGAHVIQGIGANFIPPNFDKSLVDEVVTVKGRDAVETSRLAMRRCGIFAGISSGAALKAAADIAVSEPEKTVLAVLPDTAERYLSGLLFEDYRV